MGLVQIPELLRCDTHGMVVTDSGQLCPVYSSDTEVARKRYKLACRSGDRGADAARLLARDPAARPVTP